MAKNRDTRYAPQILTRLSKTSLADIVWELVATAPGVNCDDDDQKWAELIRAAGRIGAPSGDRKMLLKGRERVARPAVEDSRHDPEV